MLQVSKISSMGMKKLQLTFILGFFVSFVSFAQSDRERNLPELPKSSDPVSQFENPDAPDSYQRLENGQKNNPVQIKETKPAAAAGLKKENTLYRQGGEKDGKKEEISTLSFNLFLYIVDRFKED
jgi:hypothetical protein